MFQRTPSSIDVRGNRPTDPEWAERSSPAGSSGGWRTSTPWSPAAPQDEDLVSDGWTDIIRKLADRCRTRAPGATSRRRTSAETMELADFEKMEQIRARVDDDRRGPDDRRGAEALVPAVLQAAAASTTSTSPTFNRPNVTLVDTQGTGRRADHRDGRRRRRRRVRGRLPHLRHRLRGRHRLHAPRPASRSTAAAAAALTEKWANGAAHAARLPQPRLPELLHHRPHPERASRRTSRTCWTNRHATSPTS